MERENRPKRTEGIWMIFWIFDFQPLGGKFRFANIKSQLKSSNIKIVKL